MYHFLDKLTSSSELNRASIWYRLLCVRKILIVDAALFGSNGCSGYHLSISSIPHIDFFSNNY